MRIFFSRRRTPRWLYWLLQAACAYVLVSELIGVADALAARDELARMVPGGLGARLFLRPFIFSGLMLFAWHRFFWAEREPARLIAVAAAIALGLTSVVMWLNAEVNDIHQPAWLAVGYPLAALVFLAYATAAREQESSGF